jgi:hypothetical protein
MTDETAPPPHEPVLPTDVADPDAGVAPVEPADQRWLDEAGALLASGAAEAAVPEALEPYDPLVDAPLSRQEREWLEDATWREPVYDQIDRQRAAWAPAHDAGPTGEQKTAARPAATAATDGPRWSPEAWAQALRRICTDAHVSRDLSTDAYPATVRLRRYLDARDRTCTFPGCPRLAAGGDKDHLLPWPRGRTTADNLAKSASTTTRPSTPASP